MVCLREACALDALVSSSCYGAVARHVVARARRTNVGPCQRVRRGVLSVEMLSLQAERGGWRMVDLKEIAVGGVVGN